MLKPLQLALLSVKRQLHLIKNKGWRLVLQAVDLCLVWLPLPCLQEPNEGWKVVSSKTFRLQKDNCGCGEDADSADNLLSDFGGGSVMLWDSICCIYRDSGFVIWEFEKHEQRNEKDLLQYRA